MKSCLNISHVFHVYLEFRCQIIASPVNTSSTARTMSSGSIENVFMSSSSLSRKETGSLFSSNFRFHFRMRLVDRMDGVGVSLTSVECPAPGLRQPSPEPRIRLVPCMRRRFFTPRVSCRSTKSFFAGRTCPGRHSPALGILGPYRCARVEMSRVALVSALRLRNT